MTKHTRISLYSFASMEVGHSITVGGDGKKIKSFRAAAHAFGARHGRVFSVTKLAQGVVKCTRLADETVRAVANSKYQFHTLAAGGTITIPLSIQAKSAAQMYAKRHGIVIVASSGADGTLELSRQH